MKGKCRFSAPVTPRFCAVLFLFAFAVMAVLMYCAPFMSDDFEFSSFDFANLGEALDYCLHYGNGRLLGNLGNIVLLLAPFWRIVVKAGVIAGILVLLPAALKLKSRLSYLLSFLLFICLAPSMFAQVYTWTSGFQNYVPSLLLLIFCYMLWAAEKPTPLWQTLLKALAIFVLALMGQLYVEHGTILSIALGVAAVVYSIVRDKKKTLLSILYLSGALAGGAVMFLIPRLFGTEYRLSSLYRRVFLDSLTEMLSTIGSNLPQLVYFFAGAVPLCLALGFGAYALLRKTKEAWKHPGLQKAAECIALLFSFYTLLNNLLFRDTEAYLLPDLPALFFTLLCIAFLCVLVCIAAHLDNKTLRVRLYVFTAAAVVSLAPLLIVSPIKERCVFQCYLFLAAAALSMLEELASGAPEARQALGFRYGTLLCAVLSVCLLYTFANIHWVNTQRIDYITDKLQEQPSEISVCRIPSNYTFGDSSYYLGTWYYNEEPHDVEFTFTDFASWQARRRAEGWYEQK